MGRGYSELGNHNIAVKQYTKALAISRTALGDNHLDFAKTLKDMGDEQSRLWKFDLASRQFTKALAIQNTVLGYNYSDVTNILYDMGMLFYRLHKHCFTVAIHAR